MSLDTVAEDIREEARERAEEIRADADARVSEILEEAEAEAEEIREDRRREVERTIEREREQQLSSAKLEAKQARLEARRDVLEDVRSAVEDAVANIDGEAREELTGALLADAATEFEDADAVSVYGREGDADLIADLVEAYDGFAHAGAVECLGGVVVESEESRVRVDNTFDSVLDAVWEDHLRDVSDRLFEDQ